ncbi:hypothetical protein KI387_037546, partial [Taxus chinensis]
SRVRLSSDLMSIQRSFRLRLDNLANMPLCTVCKEAYPGIKVKLTATGPICTRCYSE